MKITGEAASACEEAAAAFLAELKQVKEKGICVQEKTQYILYLVFKVSGIHWGSWNIILVDIRGMTQENFCMFKIYEISNILWHLAMC